MQTFDFSEALNRIKAGKCVQRAGWNGKGMHVYLEDGYKQSIKAGVFKGQTREYAPAIYMFTAHGVHQPGWQPSQADLFAEDWAEVSGN